MDRNSEEATERVNFDVTGELAEWIQDMKRRGFFVTTPEIVRLSLTLLRHHYRQRLGVTVERETKESEGH
jgi:Arc/MetJ-type ribon-helix-helix transcriptional regulator